MNAILGVGGGIAAYKSAELARALMERGMRVQPVLTQAAQRFITPLTFAALTGRKAITDLFASSGSAEETLSSAIEHISVAQENDVMVIAPATADLMARLAHGHAVDFLTTCYLAFTGRVVLAPAMNVNMWMHPATQENLAILRKRGHLIVEPDEGMLACGMAEQDGSIIWEEGFGWANRESGLKAAANTPFTLASITKPFTTTTLMLLAAEGKLDLDDPANKYLRPSSVQGPNGNPEEATLRRLGAHIGGLPSMFEWYFPDKAQYSPPAESLLRDYGRLAYPPGRCNEYSNIGYAALGAVAANVAGMDFGSLMTRRVLEPLRLRDSFFGTNVERLKTSAARYDDSGNPIPYYTTSTPPSGELYASAHDLALFAMFNLKNDLALRSPILESRWIDELHKPVFVGQSGTAATFGWFSGQTKTGTQVVFKGGGQPGVSTMLYMVPSENLACLALTNRSNGSEAAFRVCDQIMATILPQWSQPVRVWDRRPLL